MLDKVWVIILLYLALTPAVLGDFFWAHKKILCTEDRLTKKNNKRLSIKFKYSLFHSKTITKTHKHKKQKVQQTHCVRSNPIFGQRYCSLQTKQIGESTVIMGSVKIP